MVSLILQQIGVKFFLARFYFPTHPQMFCFLLQEVTDLSSLQEISLSCSDDSF